MPLLLLESQKLGHDDASLRDFYNFLNLIVQFIISVSLYGCLPDQNDVAVNIRENCPNESC